MMLNVFTQPSFQIVIPSGSASHREMKPDVQLNQKPLEHMYIHTYIHIVKLLSGPSLAISGAIVWAK